jgi:tRNA(Ile)-lysidine synthetase-like protein
MARAARRRPGTFGPPWLKARLAQLLPQFPRVRLCVAFSGGADSTALLGALAGLARPPLEVRALYVDHGLQPASASWGRQCRRVAQSLGIPYAMRRARIVRARGESLEAAARTARYRLFARALREGEVLLTAHHQDDQCETLLLQLLRGAGLAGLAAMPASAALGRGLLVRPLLEVPRAELRAWVQAQRLAWLEDDSNAQLHLDRNYLRARVLPPLLERWPAAAATVARAAGHLAEGQQLLEALAAEDLGRARHGAQLAASALRALPLARRRNALRAWLGALGARPPSTSVLAQLAGALLSAREDAQPRVAWEGAYVERCADRLSLHDPGVVLLRSRQRPLLQRPSPGAGARSGAARCLMGPEPCRCGVMCTDRWIWTHWARWCSCAPAPEASGCVRCAVARAVRSSSCCRKRACHWHCARSCRFCLTASGSSPPVTCGSTNPCRRARTVRTAGGSSGSDAGESARQQTAQMC